MSGPHKVHWYGDNRIKACRVINPPPGGKAMPKAIVTNEPGRVTCRRCRRLIQSLLLKKDRP